MKSTTKLQFSILGLSSVIAIVLFAVLALAPSIAWTSNSDWSGGTFGNTTSINGDLMLNNTIVNGTQTIYSWLYNNWTYRKAIIINGSTSLLNDYQVPINLTTAIYNNTGLVGSWHFSEGTGNRTADSSGYGNDGTCTNMPNQLCNFTAGKFGNALRFDGVNDYVNVSNEQNFDFEYNRPFGLELWLKIPSIPSGTQQLISKFTEGAIPKGWETRIQALDSGEYNFMFYMDSANAGEWLSIWADKNISTFAGDNIFHQFVLAYGGSGTTSGVNLYIDGELQTKKTNNGADITSSILNDMNVHIGRYSYSATAYFNGTIDEVRIYNRSLSAAEIAEQYQAGKSRLDYQDLRFTWLNSTSNAEQNISYWLESDNQAWVKVPNVTASSVANTTLYMYYGNPSAASASNGTNTFEFFDDFSGDLSKWSVTQSTSGNVQIVNGELRMYGNGAWGTNGMLSVSSFTKPFVLEASNTRVTGATNPYFFMGLMNPLGDPYGTNGLSLYYGVDAGVPRIHRFKDTNERVLFGDTSESKLYNVSKNYNWKFIIKNSGYSLYIDNVFLEDDTTWSQGTSDKIVFSKHSTDGYGYADNARVRKYASPEPSALSIGAEQTASSRGTYLSNTTTTASTIASITAIINKTEYNYNGALNLTNLTIDISANGGSSWCGNVANNTAYTSANGCGGIGSGTQLRYRINFSTNDTTKTAVVSDITMNYITNTAPKWFANATKLSSPQTYNTGTTYGWQINSSDENMNNTWFQLGRPSGTLTNYTALNNSASGKDVWYYNLTQTALGGVGTYNITWFLNDTENAQNKSDTVNYVISKGTPSLAIASNGTQTYPYTSTAEGSETNSGDADITYWLSRNSSMKDSTSPYFETVLLGAGVYNYTFNTSSTSYENWTANASGVSVLLTINKAATFTRLFLNGTEGNKNYNLSQTANFTVMLNISGKTARLDTNLTGWSMASGATPLYNYTQLQQSGIFNITGYFAGDENYTASSATYFANVTSIIANITLNLALHLGSIFADDSIQSTANDICISDNSGWFGLTSENPAQAQSGNLSADYNINVSFTSDNKAFLAFGKGSCNNFRNRAADAQLKRFLSPLMSFSYAKTNLIQLILQFNNTDITNDAHWGKGTYLLSIANQGYNAASGKQLLAVRVVK